MKTPLLLGIMIIAICGTSAEVRWRIEETTEGRPSRLVEYQWSDAAGVRTLTMRREDSLSEVAVDAAGGTAKWRSVGWDGTPMELGAEDSRFSRDGSLPWYQLLPQLAPFVVGPDKEMRFFIVPERLDGRLRASGPTKLRAKKIAEETVEAEGMTVSAWKVRITFDDLRSAFWGADYWFRKSDGLLVRYEERRGGPGTPTTIGLLVGED